MTSRRRLVALLSLLAATMAIGVATRWGDLRRWHARNLLESGDGAGGLAILQSEVERDPDDPDLRLELAIVLLSSGAPAKAEPHLEILAATPEIPERVPAFRALARIARDRKDWTREREILRAFAIAVPEDRQACLDLGDVDDRLEAEDADILERAAVRFADDDSILAYFARSVRRKGDPERALALVRDRLRRPDPPAWFFSEAARLLLLKSDQAAALNVASDAVRRFPDDPDLWGVLAAAEFHSGHATKSLAAYRRAAALEPHNRPYVDAIVYLLSRTGRAEEALRVLRDFETRASPEDAPLVAAAIRSVVRQTRSGHAPARVEIRLSADLPAGIDSASLWGTFNDRGIQDPRAALHRVEAATLETGGRRISATVTLSSDAPLPYLAVLAAGRDPPTGVVPALATASFQVGHLASGKGDVHLTATRPIPAPAGGIVTDLAARHASSGGPDSGPRRLVAFWIDGGSWYLYRSVAALGRIPVLSSLERSGAVAAMASIPHTQEVLDEITGTGVRVPTLYSMSVQAVGQVRLAVGDVGPLRAFDPARFQALDSPEIRSLRDRLASAGRSSLFVLFNDMEVNSGDDLSFLDREGRPVKVDAGDLLARPLDVDGMIRALRAETGPEASEPTLAFAATEIARLQRRLDVMSILIDRYQPDLTLFRIDETDLLAHRLWNTLETLDPGLPSGPPDPHRRLLEVAYERLDAATGALLASLDPGTNVIVFSDHGILDQVRHDPVAMFLAVGPSFERSIVLRDLRVEHLRPLFLKLQGAPLDRGMVLPVGLLRESPRLGAVR